MGGTQAEQPQEGRMQRGVLLLGAQGSGTRGVGLEMMAEYPTDYWLLNDSSRLQYELRDRPRDRFPLLLTRKPTRARDVVIIYVGFMWFVVRAWRPRDQVEDHLRRAVEEGIRSERWVEQQLREWDRSQADGTPLFPHLHLNLGDGQLTPPQAAEAVHLGFQRFLSDKSE